MVTHKWAAYGFTHEWAVITQKQAGAAYGITRERAVITRKWAGKIDRTSKGNSAQM